MKICVVQAYEDINEFVRNFFIFKITNFLVMLDKLHALEVNPNKHFA
jgi:hypothetical protein